MDILIYAMKSKPFLLTSSLKIIMRPGKVNSLTQREMDIVLLIKEGNSSREIAEKA